MSLEDWKSLNEREKMYYRGLYDGVFRYDEMSSERELENEITDIDGRLEAISNDEWALPSPPRRLNEREPREDTAREVVGDIRDALNIDGDADIAGIVCDRIAD